MTVPNRNALKMRGSLAPDRAHWWMCAARVVVFSRLARPRPAAMLRRSRAGLLRAV